MKFEAALRVLARIALLPLFFQSLPAAAVGGELKVSVSNYPLAYFIERIGGTEVTVSFPVPAEEDPPFWKPDPDAVARMQQADLIALNGAGYEKWLDRVSLPKLKQVDTSAGFKQAYIHIDNAVTHSHGPGGVHSHAGTAYTTWLDFKQAGKQAEALAHGLISKRSESKGVFLDNLNRLLNDLEAIDAELLNIGEAANNRPLLGSHPVYQYLARRYGLNLLAVHWEPNAMPASEEWSLLENTLASHPAKLMIWEAQPSPEIAARLLDKGVKSIVFDPCAQRPENGDFLSTMHLNIARLKSAL